MEAPLSPSKLKRRLPLSETDCNGIPPSKRSYPRISAQASDQTSELSDSDCSTPKNGDLPGANLPGESKIFMTHAINDVFDQMNRRLFMVFPCQ